MEINSIYKTIPDNLPEEVIEELIHDQTVCIKRIVSQGHASPPGFWYDQEENEWIIVLEGSAGLLLEGDENQTVLKKGDYLNIPAHTKHRVEWTEKTGETIWLAIFYK
jgi:cupin 2 domain-containing protein